MVAADRYRVCSNVIETYSGDGLMASGKGMVVFSIVGSYPTATLAARLSLEQLVPSWRPDATKINGNKSCLRGAAVTTTILAISASVSAACPACRRAPTVSCLLACRLILH